MKIFRKLRVAARLNRRKRVEQMARERVQLREFNGGLYIALDGIPVQRVYQGAGDVVALLNNTREVVRAYLMRDEAVYGGVLE